MTFNNFFRKLFEYICKNSSHTAPDWVHDPKLYTDFACNTAWKRRLNMDAVIYVITNMANFCKGKVSNPCEDTHLSEQDFDKIYQFFSDLYKSFLQPSLLHDKEKKLNQLRMEICFQYAYYHFHQGDYEYLMSVKDGFSIFLQKFEAIIGIPNNSLVIPFEENLQKDELHPVPFNETLTSYGWNPDKHQSFVNASDMYDKLQITAQLLADKLKSKLGDNVITIEYASKTCNLFFTYFGKMCFEFYDINETMHFLKKAMSEPPQMN